MFRASTILLKKAPSKAPLRRFPEHREHLFFIGIVVGTAGPKTVKVEKIGNPINNKNNFLVHDEKSECIIGDMVGCRIISIDSGGKLRKLKNFTLHEIFVPVDPGPNATDAERKAYLERPATQAYLEAMRDCPPYF
ncbi:hypothetical protein DFS34DRAFT_645408 [Phlyctochytrium arcticum]|nr:hypothetical protein DFS34DRAFT_645408 [Phlyctochytrium arcticum]